jgi:hypothetical protein
MKAIIEINFKRIAGKKVDKQLLILNPKLPDATKQTLAILCQQIKRYFDEHKIKVKVNFKLENDR